MVLEVDTSGKCISACISWNGIDNSTLLRIIKAYITYHLRRNSKWLPKIVNHETPKHICEFITQKCGLKEKGFEGRKVTLSTFLMVQYLQCFVSIQQLSQHGQHSHSGTDLFDLTKVLLSGATIPRPMFRMYSFISTCRCACVDKISVPVMDCQHVHVRCLRSWWGWRRRRRGRARSQSQHGLYLCRTCTASTINVFDHLQLQQKCDRGLYDM